MTTQELATELQRGPAFLLLGQAYYELTGDANPFLGEIEERWPMSDGAYGAIRQGLAGDDQQATLMWLAQRARLSGPPSWFDLITPYAWSGVYSSAIDTIWERAFRNEWRETEPVFSTEFVPADPRNKIRLHCTYLFGSVGRTETEEIPPLDPFSFAERSAVAATLLARLASDITPLGHILIGGYDPAADWLEPEK